MTTIDWRRQLGNVEGEEIPFDVTFNIYEEGTLSGKVKAHKTLLAFASPVFKGQFFTCDTQDKNAAEINIYDTTYFAFNLMITDVYSKSKHTLKEWLEGFAKIGEVFEVLKLVKRYMIDDQVAATEKSLANCSLTWSNIVDSAATAERFFATDLEPEAKQLHLRCVKMLRFFISGPDGGCRAAQFVEDHLDRLEVASKLLVQSKEHHCPNCEHDPCKHGKMVRAEFDEFKDGLGVMFTVAELNDCSAKVTKDIGANNMRVQDDLFLEDFSSHARDIDGGRLYYNCEPKFIDFKV